MIGNQTLDSAVTTSAAAALQRSAASHYKMTTVNFALVCLIPPK